MNHRETDQHTGMDPRLVQHDDAVPASTANTESSATTNPSYKLPTTDDTNGIVIESENANHTRIMLAEEQDVMDEDDDDAVRATAATAAAGNSREKDDDDDEELQDAPLPMMISNDHIGGSMLRGDGTITTTANTTAASSMVTTQRQLLQPHVQSHRNKRLQPLLLYDRIIMPSPYSQHNTGTSRFRTAFGRILQDSYNDIEAWQAVMTEASACDSAIFDKSAQDNYLKLDWVESCYGALLHRFPYSTTHIIGAAELLLQQVMAISKVLTALSTSRHPLHIATMKQRSMICHAKLQHLFHVYLGTDLNIGSDDGDDDVGVDQQQQQQLQQQQSLPMCAWVVELWLLYIRMVQHDASSTITSISTATDQQRVLRDTVTAAYDMAVTAAGDANNNHLLWKSYLEFVQTWTTVPPQQQQQLLSLSSSATNVDHGLIQRQMVQLRSIYQRAVTYPMTGLDTLWQEYENFEKQQSEALAAALIQELAPKYQQARSVYLERIRVLNTGDLQRGRLATPPVSASDNHDDDYHNKLLDEYNLLRLWKTRCSYERTNPGRLTALELSKRVRSTFAEMACTLTRHPETWHMWSTWELIHGSTTSTVATAASGNDTSVQLSPAATKAVMVLQLGQEHIPDSTLLAYGEAQIYEAYHTVPKTCCTVLEKFLLRSPNTLGFVLYQQLIRRYEGKEPARAVFTRARKSLSTAKVIVSTKKKKDDAAIDDGKVDVDITEVDKLKSEDDNGKRKMVTNRLDASVGIVTPDTTGVNANGSSGKSNKEAGPITWHLYAAHAVMEHRQNHSPGIAARVYELGLRKHATFLTVPSYIQRYAQLLLELNDTMNLRALLTRAVAACELENKQDAVASLWDMTLYFESVGGTGTPSITSLQAIEKRRHEALFGPEFEDVATGGIVGVGDSVLIGPQKSSIAEQLIRDEGYEICSRIVSGLSRTVDVLNVMGLWGSGNTEARHRRTAAITDHQSEFSGGQSDASFQKRLMFEKMTHAGLSPEIAMADAAVGSKILTARERLAGPGGAGGVGGGTAIMLAIQQSPDWLRPLLLLLPASHSRLPIVAKPPPHLTEMALSTLRQNELPAERPSDGGKIKGTKRSISTTNDGNSSDEDDAGAGASGYGNAFRVRQRARMVENGTDRL